MRALAATMRAAMAEAWANRAGFWVQVTAMIVNDLAWVVFWVLFVNRVGTLNGWDTQRILLLQAVLTSAGGIVLGIFANARSIGRLVSGGEIDAALALPTPALAHLLVRRVNATNLGDIAFGFGLFMIAGQPSLERTAVYLLGTITGAVLLTGFLVAVGSLAFFAGREDAGELGFHAMLMFAAYPVDLFGGAARLLLHTVVPAAFVAGVPAILIEDFDLRLAGLSVAAATVFAALGCGMFTAGLRRYTSGAVWTRA